MTAPHQVQTRSKGQCRSPVAVLPLRPNRTMRRGEYDIALPALADRTSARIDLDLLGLCRRFSLCPCCLLTPKTGRCQRVLSTGLTENRADPLPYSRRNTDADVSGTFACSHGTTDSEPSLLGRTKHQPGWEPSLPGRARHHILQCGTAAFGDHQNSHTLPTQILLQLQGFVLGREEGLDPIGDPVGGSI